MLLAPCTAVHTVGMRFAIDVVFVDRQGFAVKIVRNLRPWRIALAAGGQRRDRDGRRQPRWGKVLLGDRLYLAPVSAHAEEPARPPRAGGASRRIACAP